MTTSANPQTTELSFNILATTTWAGDSLGTMAIVFTFDGEQMGFPVQVSGNGPMATIEQTLNYGTAIIEAGASVSLNMDAPNALVQFSGSVGNGSTSLPLNGLQIAGFNNIT
ncbi:hypothetical protein J2X19_001761 [Rhodoferax ferrireducens]|uniref:Uncharacterized protein n=1 Tax=Rhodoferax ferrireducens TaxID=192843 RepID=A0ABU2C704_9BURK|nr:hypothetical protein [Rhodoferax ferrireducens]MDR7377103.1 hypothetical protein [Rhodoferax ferrireducens]